MTARPIPLAAPRGMRDLLPAETAEVGAVSRALLERFALEGYARVTTPAFEYADVLERGLELDRRDLIRFVEPDTGEVALLRPDITPQIARIVATRLQDRPAPWRLSYSGTVIRRKRGRARPERQAMQAGVEHIGTRGLDADIEVLRLACTSVQALGLTDFRLELGQVGLVRHALDAVPEDHRASVAEAMSRKDANTTEARAKAAGTKAAGRRVLVDLLGMWGGREVLNDASRLGRWAAPMLDELRSIADRVPDGVRLGVDLGEPRGRAYYTGASFALLAEGPGEPIGAGGRYDDLVGRFGAAQPATGFALDVDHLRWALRAASNPPAPRSARILCAGAGAQSVADALRARGVVAAIVKTSRREGLEYCRAWGYDALAHGRVFQRALDGAERQNDDDLDGLLAWATQAITSEPSES